jgi:hypothetical protein
MANSFHCRCLVTEVCGTDYKVKHVLCRIQSCEYYVFQAAKPSGLVDGYQKVRRYISEVIIFY